MRSTRRRFLQFAAVAASVPALPRYASALDYPTRAVRFIVPYPAGGATDAAARVVGEFLSRSLGQQIMVEKK
jgi:tripartite-type tricarboxylate transporter receptor subunit TctC